MHHRSVLYDKDDFDFFDRTNTNCMAIKIGIAIFQIIFLIF